jgi:hypothetical protein
VATPTCIQEREPGAPARTPASAGTSRLPTTPATRGAAQTHSISKKKRKQINERKSVQIKIQKKDLKGEGGVENSSGMESGRGPKAQVRLQGRALAAVAILLCRLQGQRGVLRQAPPDAATTRVGAIIPLATAAHSKILWGGDPAAAHAARGQRKTYPHQEVAWRRYPNTSCEWRRPPKTATPAVCAVLEVDEGEGASPACHRTEMREATANLEGSSSSRPPHHLEARASWSRGGTGTAAPWSRAAGRAMPRWAWPGGRGVGCLVRTLDVRWSHGGLGYSVWELEHRFGCHGNATATPNTKAAKAAHSTSPQVV